jgi:hypothetical protein
MIVRFFKTGQSRGESPVNYLFSPRDHEGQFREHLPELVEGSPKLTIDLINGISRQHKYASGCLAFRPSEQPTKAELLTIIDRFKAVVAPGLSCDQFNSLFVLHREEPDPKTGHAGFHVHFVFPMTLLGGKTITGKDLTGKRWNPHPPGQKTIEIMALFTDLINHEHGWARVTEKPLRVGVDSFWRKAAQASHTQKSELLRKELAQAVKKGVINDRDELCEYLDQTLGLTITRQTATSVSVKFPGTSKAMRLKGPLFEAATDYTILRAAASHSHGTERLSVPQYLDAKLRLDDLLRERATSLTGPRTTQHAHTTTRKERNYGEKRATQPGTAGGPKTRRSDDRNDSVPLATSGMERNLFQTGAGQWRHANGVHDQASHAGPQEAAVSVQHSEHENFSTHRRGRQRVQRGLTPYPTGDINQKIWALAIQLNDCEAGSHEAASIVAQLNELQGERERLTYRPRPKR